MVDEKTLLQQIRDKEQQVSRMIETVKEETDTVITAAKSEAERIIQDAEKSGRSAAEELLRVENTNSQKQAEEVKKTFAAEVESAKTSGEKNLNSAADTIVNYVTLS